jgi:hypothetical protein
VGPVSRAGKGQPEHRQYVAGDEDAGKAGPGRRIHHNGDPALAWMIDNLKAKVISKDNIFPDKESPDRKIDGAVALLIALTRIEMLTASATIEFIDPPEGEGFHEEDFEE